MAENLEGVRKVTEGGDGAELEKLGARGREMEMEMAIGDEICLELLDLEEGRTFLN